jgi:hypothetical protein
MTRREKNSVLVWYDKDISYERSTGVYLSQRQKQAIQHKETKFSQKRRKMKINLHKPKRNVWIISLILFAIGLISQAINIPLLSPLAFYLVVIANGLLLLGTWLF